MSIYKHTTCIKNTLFTLSLE